MKKFIIYLGLTFSLYYLALGLGYAQDDYYFLLLSRADSIKEFLAFFSPLAQQGFPFYRPLGTQVYFYLFNSAFAMHIFMLFLHAINSWQVDRLFRKLKFSRFQAFLGSLIYLTSAIHFLSLVYIAATQHLLATTFSLLSLNLFFSGSFFSSAIVYIFALLSKESAIILPPVAFILSLYQQNISFNLKQIIKKYLPYILITISYLVFRFFGNLIIQSEYHYLFDEQIFTTLRFYAMFLFGFFEKIQDYPLNIIFSQYLRDTATYGVLPIISSITILTTFTILLFLKKLDLKRLVIGVLLFLVGISLYLGLPAHIFPHYLDYSLLGFILIILSVKISSRSLVIISTFIILGNIGGIMASFRLHWSPQRSRLNERAIPFLLSQGICDNQQVSIEGDLQKVRELYYSLSGSNGPSYICNHHIDVYYKDIQEIPQYISIINIPGNL